MTELDGGVSYEDAQVANDENVQGGDHRLSMF